MNARTPVDAEQVKERIALVRLLSNELAAHLHTLPDGVWRDPDVYASACEGWKIADVITHLILGANTFGLSLTNATKGVVAPPMGWNPPSDPQEGLARLAETRNAIHEDLFYDFNASCKRFNTLLTSLEPEQYGLPVWHPYFITSIDRLIDIRASELAVHSWDIRYPMDRDAKISAAATPFMLRFLWRWLRTGFNKDALPPAPTLYRFNLTDAAGGYDISVGDGDFRLSPYSGEPSPASDENADAANAAAADSANAAPDVEFACDTNTYILFCMSRLQLRRSLRRGRIAVTGDAAAAQRFPDLFRGV